MSWKPLFQGRRAEVLESSIMEIAQDYERYSVSVEDGSYGAGHCGIALFLAHLSVTSGDKEFATMAEKHLDQALDCVRVRTPPSGFFVGLAGIGWSVQHLARLFGVEPHPEMTEDVDSAILEAVETSPWAWEFDLVYGLAGIANYGLDHTQHRLGEKLVREVVNRLSEIAIRFDEGLSWLSTPELMTEENARQFPEGRLDLGLAHGVPGVIATLARIERSDFASEESHRLLVDSVRWLRAQRRPKGEGSLLAHPANAWVTSSWRKKRRSLK